MSYGFGPSVYSSTNYFTYLVDKSNTFRDTGRRLWKLWYFNAVYIKHYQIVNWCILVLTNIITCIIFLDNSMIYFSQEAVNVIFNVWPENKTRKCSCNVPAIMELYHGYFGFGGFEIISLYEIQIFLNCSVVEIEFQSNLDPGQKLEK